MQIAADRGTIRNPVATEVAPLGQGPDVPSRASGGAVRHGHVPPLDEYFTHSAGRLDWHRRPGHVQHVVQDLMSHLVRPRVTLPDAQVGERESNPNPHAPSAAADFKSVKPTSDRLPGEVRCGPT